MCLMVHAECKYWGKATLAVVQKGDEDLCMQAAAQVGFKQCIFREEIQDFRRQSGITLCCLHLTAVTLTRLTQLGICEGGEYLNNTVLSLKLN